MPSLATRLSDLFNKHKPDDQQPYTEAASKCHLPIGNETSTTTTLHDGRQLGYAEYGQVTGDAVFHLHGLPSSRLEAAHWDADAKNLGLRIISVDRPGIGLSSPSAKRGISDHANDILQLAEHLGLERYGVVGASGGGPYALACAAFLPADKLKTVTVCCGSGPIDAGSQGMQWKNKLGSLITPYLPSVVRLFYQIQPGGRLDLSRDERFYRFRQQNSILDMNGKEANIMQDDDALLAHLRTCEEAFRQGFDGSVLDARLLFSRWDFKLEDIRPDLHIELWYGRKDEHVPGSVGEYIATRLGDRAHLHLLDDTHLGIIFGRGPEWLECTARNLRNE